MAIKDRVDFLISDSRIHGGPLAWKLRTPIGSVQPAVKVFSIKFFRAVQRAANIDAVPYVGEDQFKPISSFRSAFGNAPDVNGPLKKG